MNIYDIAREAGVSISTVSRVLNNKGNVTAATRARVEEVLARSNYTPSAIARGISAFRTMPARLIPSSASSGAGDTKSLCATRAASGKRRSVICARSRKNTPTA